MGSFTSCDQRPTASTTAAPHSYDADKVLRNFDTSTPTAAVIGAGITGVHIAYELAQLGFRVTVFEQRRDIGLGETQYALPFVGVGLLHPYIHSIRMGRELLWSKLKLNSKDIVTVDFSWNFLFSSFIHRWLWARKWGKLRAEEVMKYTNNLARLSVGVIDELSHKHKTLAPYVLSRNVTVQTLEEGPRADKREAILHQAATAHRQPLMVDLVGWTRELAKVCREKYGVEFAVGEKLLDFKTTLSFGVEVVSGLRFSRNVDGRVEYKNRVFDVVVLAAGAQTGELTWESSQIPIVGLAGCSVALRPGAGEGVGELMGKLHLSSPGLVMVSPESHLVCYRTSASNDAGGEVLFLQGLLSLDCTVRTLPRVGRMLSRIEAHLREKCQINIPLLHRYRECGGRQQLDDGNTHVVTSNPVMHAAEYIRSSTPDGVPFIGDNGAAFNSFICAGFGDHAADMAPGAAKILAKFIELKACAMQRQDEKTMERDGYNIAAVMSDERVEKTRRELQLLLNGCQTIDDIPPGGELENFVQLPYSYTRFDGVVKDQIPDVAHVSLLQRVSDMEKRLLQTFAPWEHYINQQAIKLSRRDNVPDWLRTIVYYYFLDESDDLEMLKNKQKYVEGIRRIREQFEEGNETSASGATPSSSS
ncbi:hypothetical protein, conserved [Trypanosoma brucei brucei TREU927]|uniref:FAD-dependent oxidoreductase domain-containing protein 1 n=1 Tax=Trypanosoma brucei brucei (strain 927/4 GUTat10.1) TaxID=185431 RepID=Q38A60_TRYB2|nr:hypothetical protein, conserved [Trypanosoma brucei brucei TREU927]EAN78310.1 hypothetical protein, conserved [Trypanosoma brucei brucei TREU927]